MRVIGIDPGTQTTGWGIVEAVGNSLRHVAHGCVRTQTGEPLPDRLGKIFAELARVITEYQPQQAVVEEIFVSQNVQSALKLGHARGVAIVAANHLGLPIHEYTALQVKKAVVGYGRAEKSQMQEMVRILLNMPRNAPTDAADALGVAICHLNHLPRHAIRPVVPSPVGVSS